MKKIQNLLLSLLILCAFTTSSLAFDDIEYTKGLISGVREKNIEIIKENVSKAIQAGLITQEEGDIVIDNYEFKFESDKNSSVNDEDLPKTYSQLRDDALENNTNGYATKMEEAILRKNPALLADQEKNRGEKYVFIYDENGDKIDTQSDTDKVLEVMAPIIQEVYQDPNIYISQLSEKQQEQFQAIRTKLQKILSGSFSKKLNSYSQEIKEGTITTILEKAENLKNSNSNTYMKAMYEEVIIQIGELK